MIRTGFASNLAAFTLAVAVHLGILGWVFSQDAPVATVEGSGGATVARLGTSFADMAASVAQPDTPTPVETPEPVETVTPNPPVETIVPTETREPLESTTSETQPAQRPTQTLTPTALPEPAQKVLTPAAIASVQSATVLKPTEIASPTEAQNPETIQASVPKPDAIKPIEQPKPEEPTKPKTAEKPKTKPEKTKPTPVKPAKQPSAVSIQTTAGQAEGTKTKKEVSTGTGKRKSEAGNSAATNYAGQINRRIQKMARRLRAKGAARVNFKIASNGGLVWVKISKSSGSRKLDSEVLRLIKRAAPFPSPPAGAQTEFGITVKSR